MNTNKDTSNQILCTFAIIIEPTIAPPIVPIISIAVKLNVNNISERRSKTHTVIKTQ
jgi:hypothetical protein